MTEEDIQYRQGRSKKQQEGSEKLGFISCMGLLIVLLAIIIYGIFS
jgi:hypothetical protein|tara:strand:- start:292 stop:429 length:138 start_codon:yes stop_codon:yes gene_type:complete